MDLAQIKHDLIAPAITSLRLLDTPAAINLVMGTGLQETGFDWVHQVDGEALGAFQLEPATITDILDNWLQVRPMMRAAFRDLAAPGAWVDQVEWNVPLGAALARIVYWRTPDPMPAADDAEGMARFYKLRYNTPAGAARLGPELTAKFARAIAL